MESSRFKKVVQYDASKGVFFYNGSAVLWPINHPDKENVSNEKSVTTSVVVHEQDGVIETMNTVYHPYYPAT